MWGKNGSRNWNEEKKIKREKKFWHFISLSLNSVQATVYGVLNEIEIYLWVLLIGYLVVDYWFGVLSRTICSEWGSKLGNFFKILLQRNTKMEFLHELKICTKSRKSQSLAFLMLSAATSQHPKLVFCILSWDSIHPTPIPISKTQSKS